MIFFVIPSAHFICHLSIEKELPKSIPEEYRQGTYALGDTDKNAPIPKEAYKKLPSGVIYADIRPGNKDGDAVTSGSRVNM